MWNWNDLNETEHYEAEELIWADLGSTPQTSGLVQIFLSCVSAHHRPFHLVDIQGCIPWNHHHTSRVFSFAPNHSLSACFFFPFFGPRHPRAFICKCTVCTVWKSLQATLSPDVSCYTQAPSTKASSMFFSRAPFKRGPKCHWPLRFCFANRAAGWHHIYVLMCLLELHFSTTWFLDFILCVWLGLVAAKVLIFFYSSELLPSKSNCILILLRYYVLACCILCSKYFDISSMKSS